MRARLACLFALTGCLDAPPSSTDGIIDASGPTPDAGPEPDCLGLDNFIESFDEKDPQVDFDFLWDSAGVDYELEEGALTLTTNGGDEGITTRYPWETIGAVRVGPVILDAGATAIIFFSNTNARLTFNEDTVVASSGSLVMELDRVPEDDFFSIGFIGSEVVYAASINGTDWRELYRWPRVVPEPANFSLTVSDPDGVSSWSIYGINTPETGAPCQAE